MKNYCVPAIVLANAIAILVTFIGLIVTSNPNYDGQNRIWLIAFAISIGSVCIILILSGIRKYYKTSENRSEETDIENN
jgi:NADH:ubiquinone oxidoreductase subunit 6 (subunit J)